MRLGAVGLVVLVVSSGLGVGVAPGVGEVRGSVVGLAGELAVGSSWVERFASLHGFLGRSVGEVPFEESRGVVELVGAVYGRLGFVLSEAEAGQLAEAAAVLDPRVAWGLQQLLGAVEVGMGDWEAATAGLTAEDRALLVGHGHDHVHGGGADVQAVLGKVDGARLMVSVQRLLGVVDRVVPVLEGVGGGAGGDVVPGPNEGLLFSDPLNLILVGGPGSSVYWRNTAPGSIDPGEHVLILDVGGDDRYHNHPASAHPILGESCVLGACNGGVPVSLLVDVAGNDRYEPRFGVGSGGSAGSIGYGSFAGVGLLLDVAGDDWYMANEQASQGFGGLRGVGLLLDAAGDDQYLAIAVSQGVGEDAGSLGVLMDLGGADGYVSRTSSQGEGTWGEGVFVDLGGSDRLVAHRGSQGSSFGGGTGIMLNVGGDDAYDARENSRGNARGCLSLLGVLPCAVPSDHTAVFLDLCGVDSYVGLPGADGTTWQLSVLRVGMDDNDAPLCQVIEGGQFQSGSQATRLTV